MQIVNSLYGGGVKLIFDDLMHRYTLNGKRAPGVTSIIAGAIPKPALMYWSANVAADHFRSMLEEDTTYTAEYLDEVCKEARAAHVTKKTDAGACGTQVHNWIEAYIKGQRPKPSEDPVVRGAVMRFLSWKKARGVKFLSSEQIVYSRFYDYAGKVDFFALIEGKLWLCDIKTSKAIFPEFWVQTGSYLLARTEEYPEEISKFAGVCIIRVGKEDGEMDVVYKTDMEPYKQCFLDALALYRSLEIVNPPKYA